VRLALLGSWPAKAGLTREAYALDLRQPEELPAT
jgi:hypothetical protein